MAAPLVHASTIKSELSASSSTTASFACGGTNRVLYVGILLSAGSPPAVSSVNWNTSEGLTQIYDSGVVQSFLRLFIYRLIAPTATTATVSVTLAASCSEWYVIPVAVKDCDQTTPNGTVAGATGDTIADSLVTVSSASGKLVLDFIARFADILNEGAGQTLLQKSVASSPLYGGSSTEAGASSVSMTWASPASGTPLNWNWVQAGLSLNDVSAAGSDLSGGATLDGPAAGGTMGTPSAISGDAALGGLSAGGTMGTPSELSGAATLDGPAASGGMADAGPSDLSGGAGLEGPGAAGGMQGGSFSSLTTAPFSRNGGFLPVSIANVALAVLSDDANLTRLAGSTGITLGADGRLVFANGVPVPAGTPVIAITREPDGKLGAVRYTTHA